jgi:energy-coupling factor transport system substrate-specific component
VRKQAAIEPSSISTRKKIIMSNNTKSTTPFAWRGIDLVTAAILAVALGVAFWGFDVFVYPLVGVITAGFPPLAGLATGVWILPAVAGMVLVRRPGAAIFVELIAANVELTLGNSWGVTVLISAIIQGLAVELVFALFRYRKFGLVVAATAGAVAALFEMVGYELNAYYSEYSPVFKVVLVACAVVSGAVISGGLGTLLIRSLAKTGALNAFAVGRESANN